MVPRRMRLAAALAGLTFCPLGAAVAGHPHGSHVHHSAECPACIPGVYPDNSKDRGRGPVARHHPYRESEHTMRRAGYPQCLSHLAEPAYDQHYNGYYVGGGVAFNHGAPPHRPAQGTFGWDYDGYHPLSPRVMLGWSNRLYQGGYGAYQSETPVEVPNIFAQHPFEYVSGHFHGEEEGH
jgi:hypothetical protein